MKCMQVNGIAIDKEVEFTVIHEGLEFCFIFMPYSKYMKYNFELINPENIEKCGTVVVYSSMGNNSIEVYYIKIFISLLFFAYRIVVEEKNKELYFSEMRKDFPEASEGVLVKKYRMRESPVVKNWNIGGFWNGGFIDDIHWSIKLGRSELSGDDFESYLSRCYGSDLCDSYDKRKIFIPSVQRISITEEVLRKVNALNSLIQKGDVFGNKLKSVMRLYYEVLMIYTNMNLSIITLATIMETLLLGKDEDNQRKKVSVRAACIICDEMDSKWKTAIAEAVYFFYQYRNSIVHDGKCYLDFDEVVLNHMVENMKHIVFEIVHYYFVSNPQNISDITQIVIKNKNIDGLKNAFDYLTEDAGKYWAAFLPEE